jgi:hypothetical protein
METTIALKPNTDFVAISPRISTRRVTGHSRYVKRDGSYLDYDHNTTGLHNFSGVYRMLAKAEQAGLFADAIETGARTVCRVNSETTVSYDPKTSIARIGWTERGGRGHKYQAIIDIV